MNWKTILIAGFGMCTASSAWAQNSATQTFSLEILPPPLAISNFGGVSQASFDPLALNGTQTQYDLNMANPGAFQIETGISRWSVSMQATTTASSITQLIPNNAGTVTPLGTSAPPVLVEYGGNIQGAPRKMWSTGLTSDPPQNVGQFKWTLPNLWTTRIATGTPAGVYTWTVTATISNVP